MSALWRANAIVFTASFCVMVIELIAARILAPYIGVSLYTWTSIIGVILTGIALGNYIGGRIADKHPSPLLLTAIFLVGGLLTAAIPPSVKVVASANWFDALPLMLNFTLTTLFVFFLPAVVLSMVTPLVIKLTLADLGQTGGIVGTIYAVSTAGAILGTFLTGFLLILWFGIRMIVWLVAGVLMLTGVITWLSWKEPGKWNPTSRNLVTWLLVLATGLPSFALFQMRGLWQEVYTRESNYFTISVEPHPGIADVKMLRLDHLIDSYTNPVDPTMLVYDYVKIFEEIAAYFSEKNPAPRVLHLGGGGYTFPRYMETVYPGSVNEVVEIDPAVTEVNYTDIGLPRDTGIKTFNQDARLFLIQREAPDAKYDIVIGDVFNDRSTPYHLTTLEFARLVKSALTEDGVYLINLIDDVQTGRYVPSFIRTVGHAFDNVYVFNIGMTSGVATFVVMATDRDIDMDDYMRVITRSGARPPAGTPYNEDRLKAFLDGKNALLFTDDYAPTDILVASLVR